jgi:transposase
MPPPIPCTQKISILKEKYNTIQSCLNEKGKRLWAAVEASAYGRGGFNAVCLATGLSTATLAKAVKELQEATYSETAKVRASGGGRKKLSKKHPELLDALEKLVDPTAKGDPESHLRWTSKSVRHLAGSLKEQGFSISHQTTAALLHELGYSLQVNQKSLHGTSHEDRDNQFRFINNYISGMQNCGQPTISVDTKKKELIGNYKNHGLEYSKKDQPIKVNDHDFPDARLGKVVPYGVYDIGKNKGWVSVGISADTAQFAVNTIRTWWYKMGMKAYPEAEELLITADCGGSNGYRVKLWKVELQKLANELNLKIHICHFPPGTSKWNKIEHRLFSYISKNWRGKPLITREAVVNLIANTRTSKGLEVQAVLDENKYQSGIKVDDSEIAKLNIQGAKFHPEWNYTIGPNR